MQTLISAFDDPASARRAVERLVQAGFGRDDVHLLHEARPTAPAWDPNDRVIAERTMESAEREVAVDRDALEALGHFMVSLFGEDRGEGHARRYSDAARRGHSIVVVDANGDDEAEKAAVVLHEQGAVDVKDERADHARGRPGVRRLERDQPPLRELVKQRNLRAQSLLADR